MCRQIVSETLDFYTHTQEIYESFAGGDGEYCGFLSVTTCSLVGGYKHSQEPSPSIFRAEDGDIRIPHYGSCIPDYILW
jgi:hypothetical protein